METIKSIGLYFYYIGVDGDYWNDWQSHVSNPILHDSVVTVGKLVSMVLGWFTMVLGWFNIQ